MGRWVVAVLFLGLGSRALASESGESYEDERTHKVMASLGLSEDPAPAGKRIGHVLVVGHDVFVEDEPWPVFLNAFHWKTEEHVVRRELLFGSGDAYDQRRIDESARALRNQTIFAFVRIVAVKPTAPDAAADTVDVLVFTRDLWSLRAETTFSVTDGLVDLFALNLIERNLFGENIQAAVELALRPANWSLTESYTDRRVLGTRLRVAESIGLDFANDGGLEGTRGGLEVGVPLWDLRPRWGWEAAAAWEDSVGRQLAGADLLTWDAPSTAEDDRVPRIWDQTGIKLSLAGMRQLGGDDLIHRLRFGYTILSTHYAPHRDTGLAPGTALWDEFREEVLAPSREQHYPYLRWQVFTPRWVKFQDLAAFGVTEDVRVGPAFDLYFAAPLHTFGSDHNALTWEATASLVLAPEYCGDLALVDLLVGLGGRLEGGEVIDQIYRARLRAASARFLLGRVVLRADLESRVADSANTLVAVGGDNGLRGYPSQAFYDFGADRLRINAELRSPPWVLGSVHIGGVVFYDVGGVGEGPARLDLHHALGLGLRIMFPQFNRFAFRFDLGFPLDDDGLTVRVSFGSVQAIPLTSVEDDKLSQ